MEELRLHFRFPLPFAGITQTGSEGLPTLKVGTLSPMSSPSNILINFTQRFEICQPEGIYPPITTNLLLVIRGGSESKPESGNKNYLIISIN
jgi:hypothetical protein